MGKNMAEEDAVLLENEDELNNLEYSGDDKNRIFELIRVTKKDFSIYELHKEI